MQVTFTPQIKNQQNFGMAIYTNNNVNELLKSRIKNFSKLNKLIEREAHNDKFDVILHVPPNEKSLSAIIVNSDANNGHLPLFCTSISENKFTKLFLGPVGFIKKAADLARKKQMEMIKTK